MDFACVDIGSDVISFFEKERYPSCKTANADLLNRTGIVDFFEKEEDLIDLRRSFKTNSNIMADNRIEYGDFQTSEQLAKSVCDRLRRKGIAPAIILEPTCGQGNFILEAMKSFDSLEHIFGIEIHENYIWRLKFRLLSYFLNTPTGNKPQIHLYNRNIFDYDLGQLKNVIAGKELLIVGNPPWVTNSALSALDSTNLPAKSNFKQEKGIDAITGKGNFDISEFISLKILDVFSGENGHFAFLIKNSVIKNIILGQKKNSYPISCIEKHTINARKEFGAAVDASLFVCKLNSTPEFTAKEYDFYTAKPNVKFGWVNGKFAADIEKYRQYSKFDGVCPFEWRQGIKHDCAKIMELERIEGGFRNALGEEFELEEDLVYGLLKSSDLKEDRVNNSRKYTIVTQKRTGQDTLRILENLPKTKAYLQRHKEHFSRRKSTIYKGKPMYSIFGIGDYSFKPYKIAISGLYKQTRFTLVEPNGTILMLDDTCYFIGFDDLEDAVMAQLLLNRPETQEFIRSFMFTDAKRAITKEMLMRIDFDPIIRDAGLKELSRFPDFCKSEIGTPTAIMAGTYERADRGEVRTENL